MIRTCGSTSRYNATPGVGFCGLEPTILNVTMDGLPLFDSGWLNYRLRRH